MEIRVVVALAPETAALVERLALAFGRAAWAMVSDDRQPAERSSAPGRAWAPAPASAAEGGPVPPVERAPAPPAAEPARETESTDDTQPPASGEEDEWPAPPAGRAAEQEGDPPAEHAPAPLAAWRTDARRAVVERMAGQGKPVMAIHRAICAMDGPPVPVDPSNTRHWLKRLDLWEGGDPVDVGALAQARGMAAARARAEATGALDENEVVSRVYGWLTRARRRVLAQLYPTGTPMPDIRAAMEKLPGAAMPLRNDEIWGAVTSLKLKRGGEVPAYLLAGGPDAAQAVASEAAPMAAADAEGDGEAGRGEAGLGGAEDVPAASPQDQPRETPQLVRARELLAMDMHPNDIKGAVKLSAVEFGLVLQEWRGRQRRAA